MPAILDHLSTLSSAEQFFAALDVAFDPQVLAVNRLHVLKGFHDRLDLTAVEAMDDTQARAACQAALGAAYAAHAGGKGEKNFKVFERAKQAFVPLSHLTF